MAEIPVEKKSSSSWIWILLLLLLGALLLWWILSDDDDADVDTVDPVVAEQSADYGDSQNVDTQGEMTLAAIAANPAQYFGREGFTGEVDVGGPLTDRGFWVENEGARMFALVIDEPAERRIDINPGMTLELNGGTVREASSISATDIEGDSLDEDTMRVIADQEAILVIDEDNMRVVEPS